MIKEKTRILTKDELVQKVTKRRSFVNLEQIDSIENMSSIGLVGGKGKGFFTVGIIVDRIGVLTSKGGKKFTIIKISDLVKYNMSRVKEHLGRQWGKDEESMKQALRAYNSDGYKTITLMCWGESALPAKEINSGTIIAIMNPRLMPPSSHNEKASQGVTFCIDTIDSVLKIGFSKDFNICVRES